MIRCQVVSGPVTIDAGLTIVLDLAQYAARSHRVEVARKGKASVVVVASEPLDFVAGEIVGLSAIPPRLSSRLVDLDADAAGVESGKPAAKTSAGEATETVAQISGEAFSA